MEIAYSLRQWSSGFSEIFSFSEYSKDLQRHRGQCSLVGRSYTVTSNSRLKYGVLLLELDISVPLLPVENLTFLQCLGCSLESDYVQIIHTLLWIYVMVYGVQHK